MNLAHRIGYTLFRTALDFSGEFLNLALAPLGARITAGIPTGIVWLRFGP